MLAGHRQEFEDESEKRQTAGSDSGWRGRQVPVVMINSCKRVNDRGISTAVFTAMVIDRQD
jgi:hypothetical protein